MTQPPFWQNLLKHHAWFRTEALGISATQDRNVESSFKLFTRADDSIVALLIENGARSTWYDGEAVAKKYAHSTEKGLAESIRDHLRKNNLLLNSQHAILIPTQTPVLGKVRAEGVTHKTAKDFMGIYAQVFTETSKDTAEQHAWACLQSKAYKNILVRTKDGRPAAIASLAERGNWAGVYNIACMPIYRGEGLGAAALHHVCALQAEKTTHVFLECLSHPKLLSWYSSQGFRAEAHCEVWIKYRS